MKGGNGVSEANGITHSPERRTKPGCVNARANLTRRRGDAENVYEVLKTMRPMRSLRLKHEKNETNEVELRPFKQPTLANTSKNVISAW